MRKFMRILVFFDLPVKTKQERKKANQFRKFLLKDGYYMIQLSVYARVCNGNDMVELHKN
ncbi:CRISPR-associated endoribonuclease Cas2 [compost metagenome]